MSEHKAYHNGSQAIFTCDGDILCTISGDGNIKGRCLLCGKDFTTNGKLNNKVIVNMDSDKKMMSRAVA